MQSAGSTSSQPSSDSLSSNSNSNSVPFSDSEQVEDDTEVFLMERCNPVVIGNHGASREYGTDALNGSGSRWAFNGFSSREEELEGGGATRDQPQDGEGEREEEKTEGNQKFLQKCAELQGFVRPLLELLQGLKKGRFDRGLSSLQQNVAMDRIQRIVGVLQRPNGGEKHLNVMLQIEMMLKQWFPHVSSSHPPQPPPTPTPQEQCPPQRPPSAPPQHQHQHHRDQLHIPVKKRRLSWTSTNAPPTLLKRLLCSGESDSPPPSSPSVSERVFPNTPDPATANRHDPGGGGGTSSGKAADCSQTTRTSTVPKPHPSPGSFGNGEKNQLLLPAVLSPGSSDDDLDSSQDSCISSTTFYANPENQLQPRGCQSQPVAGQQTEICQEPDEVPPP